jgi:hypothetical protein
MTKGGPEKGARRRYMVKSVIFQGLFSEGRSETCNLLQGCVQESRSET